MDSDLSLSPQEKKGLEMEIDPEATVGIKETKPTSAGGIEIKYSVHLHLQVHHRQKVHPHRLNPNRLLRVVKKRAGMMTKRKKVRNNSKSDWIEYSR